jgi:hypothetical protein
MLLQQNRNWLYFQQAAAHRFTLRQNLQQQE